MKESHRQGRGRRGSQLGDDDLPSSAYDTPPRRQEDSDGDDSDEATAEDERDGGAEEGDRLGQWQVGSMPSKFHLNQLSVQVTSLASIVSWICEGLRAHNLFDEMTMCCAFVASRQKGTSATLLSISLTLWPHTEWLRTDTRRTAVGLDFDRESLEWCLENNLSKIGADGYLRLLLFDGNILQPNESRLVKQKISDLVQGLNFTSDDGSTETNSCEQSDSSFTKCEANSTMSDAILPGRDIICAFNYSCCCLHKRKDLVLYFRHAFNALSERGGTFVMDVYGGTSSECKLRFQRRFPSFTYFWEQEEFDIITRETRISLHFQVGKKQMIRHAFTYHWRLWSIPEIKDCLEEAGFKSIHVWFREMPDTKSSGNAREYTADRDVKYEELQRFNQADLGTRT
ncbi:hypothetical protein CFC21_042979 [Triticum aestivum]|uniref:Methyltransferase type 11 domain-containing protein n=3 Tax=Triticum TaxID=4564 RepID=A0A9R1FM60_WHEAT|nr:hypothetical protein CFC21_042979 [Triticum aestivum]CDM80091.1 unnamed protein product [Triticum aestivum]VAH82016.1 unnamed protein product [Triticum turgidum subsp. durum]